MFIVTLITSQQMDSSNRSERQSVRRPSEEDEQSSSSRGTQTLETYFNGLQESSRDTTGRSSEQGYGSPIARNNLVTESGYRSNSSSEGEAGLGSSNSFFGEASGFDMSQVTFLKSDHLTELDATSNEIIYVRDEQTGVIEVPEVTPVPVTSEVAQETGDQFDVELHGVDGSVADIRRFPAIHFQDIDLRLRRYIQRRAGRLVRCFTCFRWPVAVQNWPCGCICNCLECADRMTRCSQCGLEIDHYTRIG